MIQFIKQLSGLLIAGILFVTACKSTGVDANLPPDYLFVAENETVALRSGFSIRADSLRDSRCPEGLQCIWSGPISAVLSLKNADKSVSVKLTDAPLFVSGNVYVRQDSSVIQLGGKKINLILRDITPHRSVSRLESVNQKAVVQVSFQ